MQYALCSDDNKVWEANEFSSLPTDQLESKRVNLICPQCHEFAWFRRESSHGHPPHFCAHHKDGCELKVEYLAVDSSFADGVVDVNAVKSGEQILVQLDKEKGAEIEVRKGNQSAPDGWGDAGRRYVIRPAISESSHHFTLRKILLRLVQSPQFRSSATEIVIYRDAEQVYVRGPVKEAIVGFDEISKENDDQVLLYWGPIASARFSADGRLWLNSSKRNQDVSVVVFEDIVKDFLETFKVDDLEDLAGAHVLIAGRCHFASTGKPIVWCASTKYIVVRRYQDERLKPNL